MKIPYVLTTAVMSLGLLVPAGASHAAAVQPECGDTVTSDVILTQDLHCDGDIGLTVASGVAVDLGGHALVGPGGSGTAIALATSDRVAIRNGTVTGWRSGVASLVVEEGASSSAAVEQVTFSENVTGMSGWFSTFEISASEFVENDEGVNGITMNAAVDRSTFTANGIVGVGVGNGGGVAVTESTFTRNAFALASSEASVTVTGSTFKGNEHAVDAFFSETVLRDNRFTENGVVYTSAYGEATDEITRNRFIRNGDVIVVSRGAHLRDNLFISNRMGVRAIEPEIFNPEMTLERNVFIKNTDAVYITMPATLKQNVAVRNSGYGIYAPNATDLGGNVAVGNGISPQCTGVTCHPR